MFDKETKTYAHMGPQPTGEEVLHTLSYMICMNEIQKYKVIVANKETIKTIKEKSNGLLPENMVFIDAPVDDKTAYAITDNILKYAMLSSRGIILKNPEMEAMTITYGRGNGKSPFSLYDVREE